MKASGSSACSVWHSSTASLNASGAAGSAVELLAHAALERAAALAVRLQALPGAALGGLSWPSPGRHAAAHGVLAVLVGEGRAEGLRCPCRRAAPCSAWRRSCGRRRPWPSGGGKCECDQLRRRAKAFSCHPLSAARARSLQRERARRTCVLGGAAASGGAAGDGRRLGLSARAWPGGGGPPGAEAPGTGARSAAGGGPGGAGNRPCRGSACSAADRPAPR